MSKNQIKLIRKTVDIDIQELDNLIACSGTRCPNLCRDCTFKGDVGCNYDYVLRLFLKNLKSQLKGGISE